jgi:hypothetical protein
LTKPKETTGVKKVGVLIAVKPIAIAANIIANAIALVFIASSNMLLTGDNLKLVNAALPYFALFLLPK